jgi:hypothetical protein
VRSSARLGTVGLVLAALLLAACGSGAVFLTIEAVGPEGTLRIPDDVDRIVVRVTDIDGSNELLLKEYPLTAEQRFPLTLGLEPGPQTGERIRVEVTAFKGEQMVGDSAAVVDITPQQESTATVRIVKS